MNAEAARAALWARAEALIASAYAAPGTTAPDEYARTRDALLDDLLAHQAAHVAAYGALCRARPPERYGGLFPALPAEVFALTRVAAHAESADARRFLTSGTSQGTARGTHALRDLRLYELAARTEASARLFAGRRARGMHLVVIGFDPAKDPRPLWADSSLCFMLERFTMWFARSASWHGTELFGGPDTEAARTLRARLSTLSAGGEPTAVLGTSFALAFAEEALADARFALPPGSFVMHTGGFKGRTQEIGPAAFRATLEARYGVPSEGTIGEYGMTELSSQCYEDTTAPVDTATSRRPFVIPPWLRVRAVDPGSLLPLQDGERGLLRIDDVANVDSCAALQTADVGRVEGEHLHLEGRAPGASLRGCALAAEEALEQARGGTP